MRTATRTTARAAEPAVAADRCAPEIVRFLTRIASARQLNGIPFGV